MSGSYFLAFDCETGGLDPEATDLLTVYFCLLDEDYKIVDELDLKLKPDDRLPIAESGALRVNGINIQEHLANPETITYSEAYKRLYTMLKKYSKKTGRVCNIKAYGYNVLFDIGFVKKHLLPQKEWESLIHYKAVDVMQAVDFLKRAAWFPQDLGSLVTVVDYLGLPKRGAHDAKNDILMTIEVDKKLLEIMKSKKDGGAQADLISLLEAE